MNKLFNVYFLLTFLIATNHVICHEYYLVADPQYCNRKLSIGSNIMFQEVVLDEDVNLTVTDEFGQTLGDGDVYTEGSKLTISVPDNTFAGKVFEVTGSSFSEAEGGNECSDFKRTNKDEPILVMPSTGDVTIKVGYAGGLGQVSLSKTITLSLSTMGDKILMPDLISSKTKSPSSKTTVKPISKTTAKPTAKPTAKATSKPTLTTKSTSKPTFKPTVRPTMKSVPVTKKPTSKPTLISTTKPQMKPIMKAKLEFVEDVSKGESNEVTTEAITQTNVIDEGMKMEESTAQTTIIVDQTTIVSKENVADAEEQNLMKENIKNIKNIPKEEQAIDSILEMKVEDILKLGNDVMVNNVVENIVDATKYEFAEVEQNGAMNIH